MSKKMLLLTAAGPDRIGFVDELTAVLVKHGANIEESRMARLAGDFAALVLISIPSGRLEELQRGLTQLGQSSVEIGFREVAAPDATGVGPYRPCTISVRGADHEGIIRAVAHALRGLGVNIAELESDVGQAPESGIPLFNMKANLQVPPQLSQAQLEEELRRVGEQMSVAIELTS